MKEYITITKTDKRIIVFIIVFNMILNMALCFKGMALMQRNAELMNEKQVLEEIIEVQKEKLED